MTPRNLALQVLDSLDDTPRFSNRYLERIFSQTHLNERDRAFIVHLVQGVLRWRLRLDWIIKSATRFPFRKIEPTILNILRIATYQIYFMDRVPDSASVNEAVKSAKISGRNHVVAFVNGILRHICRRKENISYPDKEREPESYLSSYYSYPRWLVKKWIGELGITVTERALDAGNKIPVLVLRANTIKVERDELIERLGLEDVLAKPARYSPEALTIDNLQRPINSLESFKKGLFQVQGEAAQMCSLLLSPQPGDLVLDLCAGLGGKSTHLAEIMSNRGHVIALDTNRARLVKLAESSLRLGIDGVSRIVADAAGPVSSLLRCSFDKIMVDAPCSALGIVSRHPDIKWLRNEEDIRALARLQKTILNNTAYMLKEGGNVLYATCTISRDENELVVEDFLKNNDVMTLENMKSLVPEWGNELIDEHGFFRAIPHAHGTEGFFGALFRKKRS